MLSLQEVGRIVLIGALATAVMDLWAGLLVALQGLDWVRAPTMLPALATGVATVVVPLFVMQPAMGNGYASANTPAPLMNCMRSLVNHAVFGAGLFVAAAMQRAWW